MPDRIDLFKSEHAFLSNFWGGRGSVEHYYQAEKAKWPDERKWVMQAPTPGEAKRRGRRVELRTDWEEIKDEVMLRLLRLKFSDPALADMLLNTGDAELVEGNWWGDTYWGVCKGVGQNKLGKLLMQVRSELRV